jgi:hypothetical protein
MDAFHDTMILWGISSNTCIEKITFTMEHATHFFGNYKGVNLLGLLQSFYACIGLQYARKNEWVRLNAYALHLGKII